MTRKRFIGFGLVAAGLLCLTFWCLALAEFDEATQYKNLTMTQPQFEQRFPVLTVAFKWLDFTPFDAQRYANRQTSPGSVMRPTLLGHAWWGAALAFLGGCVTTYAVRGRLAKVIHYACVIGLGGAGAIAISLSDFVRCWHGKGVR